MRTVCVELTVGGCMNQVWLSVVTNCLLFAMSTTHIAHFLPWLYV